MPLKTKLISTLLFFFAFNLMHGQQIESLKLTLRYFKNDSERSIKNSNIWITVDGKNIHPTRDKNIFTFPKIDSMKMVLINVKTNNIEFSLGPHKPWVLNNGAEIIAGKLTRIDKLQSVADYNGMLESEENYDIFSSRFFIVDGVYTIDIAEYKKVKKLHFLILNPYQEGHGSLFMAQEIIELAH